MQTRLLSIEKLNPAPYNPRKNLKPGDPEYDKLANSIDAFGYIEPVIWNERTGNVVGGHQRLKVLTERGETSIECVVVDYDEDTEKAANIALNKISGDWDFAKLADLLRDLDSMNFDMDLTGFGEDELKQMMTWTPDGGGGSAEEDDFDADAEADAIEEPVTQPGDIYVMGEHRVMCGDSTSAADVEKLMGGKIAELMVTDPPYGVEYDANWRNERVREDGSPIGGRAVGKVVNDDIADWREAWALFSGDVAYVWSAALQSNAARASLEASGFVVRSQIIWAKRGFAISRGDYHWQHEPCWYVVRKGKTGHWQGSRTQTTLWEIAHNKSETGHSTQKPVECMSRPIENNSESGALVYDPFIGSGTTLIAAEQLNRRCYGMEISPRYCDVIVKRWETLTGKKAERNGTNRQT